MAQTKPESSRARATTILLGFTCRAFRRLAARRLPRNKVVVAIARELSGFVWAIAQQVKPAH